MEKKNEKRNKIARGETYSQDNGQEKELAMSEFFTDFFFSQHQVFSNPQKGNSQFMGGYAATLSIVLSVFSMD